MSKEFLLTILNMFSECFAHSIYKNVVAWL